MWCSNNILYCAVILLTLALTVDADVIHFTSDPMKDFSKSGPCSSTGKYHRDIKIDVEGINSSYSLQVTLPTNCPADGSIQPPFPVLFFFNGFQLRASFYKKIIQRAARWGYACVQYDMRLFSITTIKAEMDGFNPLLAYLERESAPDSQTPLAGKLDLQRAVVAGHSRGGKLAALLFTDSRYQNRLQAAWLIDPIDETKYAPQSEDYPSATQAIADSGRLVGITGAGVISSCNSQGNYPGIYASAAAGSWLGMIPQASHSQFSDAGFVINAVQDYLCGKGKDSREEIVELTTTPMLAWFHRHAIQNNNRAAGDGDDSHTGRFLAFSSMPALEVDGLMANFWNWVKKEEGRGKIVFSEKLPPGSLMAGKDGMLQEEMSSVGSIKR